MNITRLKVQLAMLFMLLGVNSTTYAQTKNSKSQHFTEASEPDWSGFKFPKAKKLPKEVRVMIRSIRLIEGGSMVRVDPDFMLGDKDSAVVKTEIRDFFSPTRLLSNSDFYQEGVTEDNLEKNILAREFPGNYSPRRVTVASFWMSDHEVTNKEYRAFTDWVTEAVARQILAKKYPEKYLTPDKSRLNVNTPVDWEDPYLVGKLFLGSKRGGKLLNQKLITYSFDLDSMISYKSKDNIVDSLAIFPEPRIYGDFYMPHKNSKWDYFNNPKYDDFPVVGVSWLQAMAYCSWRTNRLNEAVLIHEKIIETSFFDDEKMWAYFEDEEHIIPDGLLFPHYRLPTKLEWEYAASGDEEQLLYVTNSVGVPILDEKGNFLYNFGNIIDENNIDLKLFGDDGAEITARVKSYPSNAYGMSDMRGNAAEWVLDGFNLEEALTKLNISSFDELNDVTNKVLEFIRENYETGHITQEGVFHEADRLAAWIIRYLNYTKQKQELKMVKGGSWLDGPMYLNIFLDNAYSQDSQSMKIGFRIARDNYCRGCWNKKNQQIRYY